MEEITIRPAKPEDAIELQTIMMKGRMTSPAYQEAFWDNLLHCKKRLNEESVLKKKTQLEQKQDSEYYKVAEIKKDKKIIALCHGYEYCKSEELTTLIPHIEDYGELKWLYVDTTLQSKGVGSLLLQDFEQWLVCRGKKKCILRTLSLNLQSNWFYKKHWYEDTGIKCPLTMLDITTSLTVYSKDL